MVIGSVILEISSTPRPMLMGLHDLKLKVIFYGIQ